MRQTQSTQACSAYFDATHLPVHATPIEAPEGAFMPHVEDDGDHVVVIYPHGNRPPEITVQNTSLDVQTVLADGIAVAIVARTNGPSLSPADVVLVERYAGTA